MKFFRLVIYGDLCFRCPFYKHTPNPSQEGKSNADLSKQ